LAVSEHGERKFAEPIEAAIAISWVEGGPGITPAKVSFRTIVWLKWEVLLRCLPLTEGVAKNRVTLLKTLSNAVAAQFRDAIERTGKAKIEQLRGRLDGAAFDAIVGRLEAAGIIARVEGPKYVRQRSTYWALTAEGARRVKQNAGLRTRTED
jgi:hypothetical protein